MLIKHLVIGGGGPNGFGFYGILKQLHYKKFWNIKNIETIYSCSIGSYVGFMLSLKYDFNWIDDYLIKRPWEKITKFKPISILNSWNDKGLVGEEIAYEVIKPLLGAKSLNANITLKEFYIYTGIEQHFYTTDLNNNCIEKVDLNYKTFPNLELYKALAMSSAFPVIFKPIMIDDSCYIDGGLLNNFPLDDCLHETQCHDNEILAIRDLIRKLNTNINDDTNLYQYIVNIIFSMKRFISSENKQKIIKNIITFPGEPFNINTWMNIMNNEELRNKYVENGKNIADRFLLDIYNDGDRDNDNSVHDNDNSVHDNHNSDHDNRNSDDDNHNSVHDNHNSVDDNHNSVDHVIINNGANDNELNEKKY